MHVKVSVERCRTHQRSVGKWCVYNSIWCLHIKSRSTLIDIFVSFRFMLFHRQRLLCEQAVSTHLVRTSTGSISHQPHIIISWPTPTPRRHNNKPRHRKTRNYAAIMR